MAEEAKTCSRGLPGKDSFLGKNIPDSISMCSSLDHIFFLPVQPDEHFQRVDPSPHSSIRTFGVFLMLNSAVNLPFASCDGLCLLPATVSWGSVDRGGCISDGFPGGLSAASLGCGH